MSPSAVVPAVAAFARTLRLHGVNPSSDEIAAAVAALATVGDDAFAARDVFRAVLRTTLVKRAADEPVFDALFSVHFGGAGAPAAVAIPDLDDPALLEAIRALKETARADDQAALDLLEALLHDINTGSAEAADAIDRHLQRALESMDLSSLTSSLQTSYYTQRLLLLAGADDVEAAFNQALGRAGSHAGSRALQGAAGLQARLRQLARAAVENRRQRNAPPPRPPEMTRALDAAELLRVRQHVQKLARHLRDRAHSRRARSRRGPLDLRRTVRHSFATGGVVSRLWHKKRRRDRPELIAVCDVSDSVRQVSVLTLELLHALSQSFHRVRTFVFVDRPVEVTALFRDHSAERAVADVIDGVVVNLSANSDYGRLMTELSNELSGSLNRRTTLLFLGDGRSNYRPAHATVLRDLKRQVRRVLWLAPEDRGTWGFGDSELPAFARYADAIHVVRSLPELGRAIDALVRSSFRR